MSAALQAAYDRSAATYDAEFESLQRPKIAYVHRHLAPAERVLDLGCGTSLYTRLTGQRCVGLDLSRQMLRLGVGPRVQGDLRQLPFCEASFDTIVCITALIDDPRPRDALTQAARVLRDRGQLAVTILGHMPVAELAQTAVNCGFAVTDIFEAGQDVGVLARRRPRR